MHHPGHIGAWIQHRLPSGRVQGSFDSQRNRHQDSRNGRGAPLSRVAANHGVGVVLSGGAIGASERWQSSLRKGCNHRCRQKQNSNTKRTKSYPHARPSRKQKTSPHLASSKSLLAARNESALSKSGSATKPRVPHISLV